MRRILIIGAGGHGQVVADALICAQKEGCSDVPVGFLDDNHRRSETSVLGLPVFGPTTRIDGIAHDAVIVGIGNNAIRRRVIHELRNNGETLVNVIHPSAVIADDVELGQGVVIAARAVINTGSIIADGVILNTACSTDHHNLVEAFAHIGPGAHLGGDVHVGEGTLIGIGAAVIRGCTVGEWSTVGVGAAVVRDVPPWSTVVGVPARVIKRREPEW